MRRTLIASTLALAGLAYGTGAGGDSEHEKLFLIYSTDERGELHPCG